MVKRKAFSTEKGFSDQAGSVPRNSTPRITTQFTIYLPAGRRAIYNFKIIFVWTKI